MNAADTLHRGKPPAPSRASGTASALPGAGPRPRARGRRRPARPACAATLALCLALTGAAAVAEPAVMDRELLQTLAEEHALGAAEAGAPPGARVSASASRLDSRLRLADCPVMPETFDPPGHRGGANVSVGVRCPQSPGWSLYIPVRLSVHGEVVVLAAPAGRGDALTDAHLRVETRDLAQLNGGWLTDADDVRGMVLRRPARPGAVLTTAMLEPDRLVRRGQRVRLIANGGAFAVASEGEALGDAAEGQRVRVRNLSSRTVVEGVVDSSGAVRTGR